jgi:hypothetical protein
MGAVWSKNEAVARKRRVTLRPQSKADGSWAPRGTVLTGFVWIRQSSDAPHLKIATGTITNKRKNIGFSSFTFTATAATDIIDKGSAHLLETGDGPFTLTTTGTLPGGLAVLTNYYFISTGANVGKLAISAANAYLGTAIDITSAGTGTHTIQAAGALTERGIDGLFEYEASQSETNIDTSEWDVYVDTGTYEAYSTIAPSTGATDLMNSLVEGSLTLGDTIRGMWAVLAGKVTNYATGSYTYKDPSTGTIDRLTFTTDATGRLTVTIINLTGP